MALVNLLRTRFFLPGIFNLSAGTSLNPSENNSIYPEVAVPVFNRFPVKRKRPFDFMPKAIMMAMTLVVVSLFFAGKAFGVVPVPTLTITFNTLSQVYGSVDVSKITFATSGWINGDSQSANLTTLPTYFCAATNSSSVAVYPITGNNDAVITSTTTYNIVYVAGSLTITGAPLTVTATGPAETPGATPSPNPGTYPSNFTYYGAVNGETVTGVTLTISPTTMGGYGTAYTVTPSAPTGANGFLAGNYIITVKTYSGICGNNYTWTGNAGATWSTAGSWTPAGPPGTNDNAIIPNTAVSPIVTTSTTVNTITFTGTEGVLVNASRTLTVNKSLTVPKGVSATFTMAATNAQLTIGTGATTANVNNAGTLSVVGGGLTLHAGANYLFNSGTVTLNGGNKFDITGNGSTGNVGLYNIGAFYVGTSNSACYLTFDDSQSILNGSTGNFFVGSTSYITYFNTSAHDCHVTNNNNFTFQSDQNGSGSILAIPQGNRNTYDGQFTVERYISAHRAYRLMSSQVYASTVSPNNVYDISYLKNYVYLSGTGGTAGGFDKAGNPTLYLSRENNVPLFTTFLNSNFRGISSINNTPTYGMNDATTTANIPVGGGYLFFYRGNRYSGLYTQAQQFTPGTPAESTVLSTTGYINQGSIVVHDWYTPGSANLGYTLISGSVNVEGFNLVGNPYPCSIDWDQTTLGGITAPNVAPFSYQLIPSGLQGAGNYNVYQAGTNVGGNKQGTLPTANSNIIASGEGFFVHATSASASLTFKETAKSSTLNTGANLYMGKPPLANNNIQYMHLQLALDSINIDGAIIRFNDDSKATFDINEDAIYKAGSGAVSLSSLSSDNMPLAINQQPFLIKGQTIPINVNASANGTYKLNMTEIKGIPQLFDVWLVDKLQKDSVNLRTTKAYSFAITKTDTTTFGSRRFALSIRQDTAYAYRLLTFGAKKVPDAKAVQVNWTTQYEENYTNFTVERSTDNGKTFDVLGGVSAAAAGAYGIVDTHPVNGLNLYRLRSEDINNTISYSKVVPIGYSDQSGKFARSNLNVFPNPAKSDINLVVLNDLSNTESYNIMITNAMGFVIKKGTSGQPNWQTSVSDLLPGTYLVKVYNNKDQALVGTTKFVKL